MTTKLPVRQADPMLSIDVLAHLGAQLVTVRRLLRVVLDQGVAIRARDVHRVVELTGVLQAELERRRMIEEARMLLLERAGARLGVDPSAVTVPLLQRLMDPETAQLAGERLAELRGLLAELQREHHCNRALMSQELAFLNHLLKLAGQDGDIGYDCAGDRRTALPSKAGAGHRVFDLEV
jgi:hypothetical protein